MQDIPCHLYLLSPPSPTMTSLLEERKKFSSVAFHGNQHRVLCDWHYQNWGQYRKSIHFGGSDSYFSHLDGHRRREYGERKGEEKEDKTKAQLKHHHQREGAVCNTGIITTTSVNRF
uniref:Expressed conserved protein n=1 Tax=Echinococcus granulosus TaxID=6210 RepID=A0A068WYT1_ECHGR|nr:hypothetical protein EgrG_000396200 [Echinococcus granulosus]